MAYVTALMDYFDYSNSVVTDDDRGLRFFVCNPTTKQFKILSHPTHKNFDDFNCFLSLAFDPLKSPHYKVVYIQFVGRFKDRYRIDIYSSETDSWSLLPNTFEVQYGIKGGGVFCNGAIHWYSHEQSSLYFDFDSGCLKKMPMPSGFSKKSRTRDVMYFGESCGRLYMVVTNDSSTLEFDVFELVSDYSEWFLRYHVDLCSLGIEFVELIWAWEDGSFVFSVLSLIGAEKEEELILVLLVDGRAMSYNLCDGTSSMLCDLKSRPGIAGVARSVLDYEGHDAYQYFESLIFISA